MRIGDLFGAIRRLWVFSLVLVVLVAAAVFFVVRSTPPTYRYTATVLLLPPKITADELEGEQGYTRANPLFYLGSLTQARDILIGAMSAKDVREEFEDDFPNSSYAVEPDALSSGPVLVAEVESTQEGEGGEALDALTSTVPDRLRALQKGVGVKKGAMIQSHPLTRDTTAEVTQTARLRQGIMAGGALAVVGLFLIGLVDALRSQRRARRGDSDVAPAAAAASPDASPAPDTSPASEAVHATVGTTTPQTGVAEAPAPTPAEAAEPLPAESDFPDANEPDTDAGEPEAAEPHEHEVNGQDRNGQDRNGQDRNGHDPDGETPGTEKRRRFGAPRVPSSGGR